jgi:predicted amidohydrolase YtcJ
MAARLTTFVVVGIVAATLIAGLIVGAQRDDNDGPIDLIVHNGAVYTAGADGAMAEAVAVRGNQIVRVGSDRDVLRLRRPQTQVIDARGAAVIPGFNDAHVHFISGGLALDKIDLLEARTLEDIQQRIRAWAVANPDQPWVLGRGWYYEPFPGGLRGLPTRQMLDALVPNRPARLVSYDGHTAWVNTKAITLAGITKRTVSPKNGVIVKDPRTGEPTGVLKEAAMSLVGRLVPAPTRDDRARALRAAVVEAQRYGVTSVQVAGGSEEDLELYDEAARAGELGVRLYAAVSTGGAPDEAFLDRLEGVRQKYADSALFKAGALKIGLDGVIEAHTAAMLAPYANRADAGQPNISADDLNRGVRLADARGWQLLTHAIGDRAIRMALDAYGHAARSNPPPSRGRRHRIEHIETVDPGDIRRFGSLGVIASMQPYHGSPSPSQIEVWTRNIGEERASRGWPYRSIASHRGHLAFGSDWPVVSLNPMLGVHTAVTRTSPDGEPKGGWHAAERLSLKAAISAYTAGSAWASFDEQRKGTLTHGMLADLVILSSNIFSAQAKPEDLASTRAVVTVFDGKVVYRRDRTGTN